MKVGLVKTPPDIHTDVVEWLCDGMEGNYIPFLNHVAALRQASTLSSDIDNIVIAEHKTTLCPNFEAELEKIIPLIPPEYNTCLLSHYVVSTWSGITFIPNTNTTLCTLTSNVQGSWAYWVRRPHIEYLLSLFDQPLRNIASFNLTPDTITRLGKVCMLHKPLIALMDTQAHCNYFQAYGFSSS